MLDFGDKGRGEFVPPVEFSQNHNIGNNKEALLCKNKNSNDKILPLVRIELRTSDIKSNILSF